MTACRSTMMSADVINYNMYCINITFASFITAMLIITINALLDITPCKTGDHGLNGAEPTYLVQVNPSMDRQSPTYVVNINNVTLVSNMGNKNFTIETTHNTAKMVYGNNISTSYDLNGQFTAKPLSFNLITYETPRIIV